MKLTTNFCFKELKPINNYLFKSRWGHSSFIYNNSIYIYGGFDGIDFLNDLIKLDLNTFTYSIINTYNTPKPRSNHCFFIKNSKFYIYGGTGYGTNYSDLHCLDMNSDSNNTYIWNCIDINGPFNGNYSSFTLIDSCLVIFGGENKEISNNSFFIFDLIKGKWKEIVMKAIRPRYFHSMECLLDKLIIFSGTNCVEYETSIPDFVVINTEDLISYESSPITMKIYNFSNSLNDICFNNSDFDNCINNTNFNNQSKRVHYFSSFPLPRWGGNMMKYKDKVLILFGGRDPFQRKNMNDFWLLIKHPVLKDEYDWIEVCFSDKNSYSKMKFTRKSSSIIVNETLIIIGGYSDESQFLNNIYVINLKFIDDYIEKYNYEKIYECLYIGCYGYERELKQDNGYNQYSQYKICMKKEYQALSQFNISPERILLNFKENGYLFFSANDHNEKGDINYNTIVQFIKRIKLILSEYISIFPYWKMVIDEFDLVILNKNTIFLSSKLIFQRRIHFEDIPNSFLSKVYSKNENKSSSYQIYKHNDQIDIVDMSYFNIDNNTIKIFLYIIYKGNSPIHITFYELSKIQNLFQCLKLYKTYSLFITKFLMIIRKNELFDNKIHDKYIYSLQELKLYLNSHVNYYINKELLDLEVNGVFYDSAYFTISDYKSVNFNEDINFNINTSLTKNTFIKSVNLFKSIKEYSLFLYINSPFLLLFLYNSQISEHNLYNHIRLSIITNKHMILYDNSNKHINNLYSLFEYMKVFDMLCLDELIKSYQIELNNINHFNKVQLIRNIYFLIIESLSYNLNDYMNWFILSLFSAESSLNNDTFYLNWFISEIKQMKMNENLPNTQEKICVNEIYKILSLYKEYLLFHLKCIYQYNVTSINEIYKGCNFYENILWIIGIVEGLL